MLSSFRLLPLLLHAPRGGKADAAEGTHCVRAHVRRQEWRGALLGPQSMDVLLQLLQEQDTSPGEGGRTRSY